MEKTKNQVRQAIKINQNKREKKKKKHTQHNF